MQPEKPDKNYLQNLNLIDLISECHLHLRQVILERREQSGNRGISHTESHLLARIRQTPLSISQVSRIMHVSRQAMQKTAVHLEERGYLTFDYIPGNKRDKYMFITEKGVIYCTDNGVLVEQMEEEIEMRIGRVDAGALKETLIKMMG